MTSLIYCWAIAPLSGPSGVRSDLVGAVLERRRQRRALAELDEHLCGISEYRATRPGQRSGKPWR